MSNCYELIINNLNNDINNEEFIKLLNYNKIFLNKIIEEIIKNFKEKNLNEKLIF